MRAFYTVSNICIGLFCICCLSFPARGVLLPSTSGIYHGAQPGFGDTEDIVTETAISDFETLAQKQIVWAYFSQNWHNGLAFPSASVQIIDSHGCIPFIRHMPWHGEQYAAETVYSLSAIIAGQFDSDLQQWADGAISFGKPILVDFGIEVNGNWFPWNGEYNGAGETAGYGDPSRYDGPERFRDAYRHIREVIQNRGADNITWFFHANNDSVPNEPWNAIEEYYPGDDVVDWIGVSIYGAQMHTDEWTLFPALIADAYPKMTALAPDKPIALLEWAVIEDPALGDKSQWITDAFTAFRSNQYPRLKAVSYWNERWENGPGDFSDLRINSSPEALTAYRTGASDPLFVTTGEFSGADPSNVNIWMPAVTFIPGDYCEVTATVTNNEGGTLTGHPLWVILDAFGVYFFAPSFTLSPENYLLSHPDWPPGQTEISVIPEFDWPTGAGAGSGLTFYGALTDPDVTRLIGEMGTFTFSWTE